MPPKVGLGRTRLAAGALTIVVALLGASTSASMLQASNDATAAGNAGFQKTLAGLVTGPHRIAPGATAFVSGPHGTWTGAAGVADVRTGEPMRTGARMRLESVSKLWTAALLLRLEGSNRLSLDDSVERWLPGLLPAGKNITLRQLLNHTSGLIDTNDVNHNPQLYLGQVKDKALRARIVAVQAKVARNPGYEFSPRLWVDFAAAVPLVMPPGSAYHYSNIGYIVAGLIAERAGGRPLAELFRREIIASLHLTSAAYDPHSTISGAHARGYRVDVKGKLTDTTTWTLGLGANGGIVADAADEARFLMSLMRGKVVGPRQLAALKTPSTLSNYGLGTGVDQSGCGGTTYGHNGGGDGFESNVYVSGDGRRVAVLLLNGRAPDSGGDDIAFAAMRKMYCAG